MKLSEIRGERAIEVIADLIEPIANIASDPKCGDLFKGKVKDGETPREAGIRNLKEKVPYLLRTHKHSIVSILGTLNDVPVKSLNLFSITKGILDLFNDKELIELFTSAAQSVEETPPIDTSKT
ncbi:MAG: hypothetical protein WC374_13385 [Phycisphaerae bacterium]|jgi:hypothetical protein